MYMYHCVQGQEMHVLFILEEVRYKEMVIVGCIVAMVSMLVYNHNHVCI